MNSPKPIKRTHTVFISASFALFVTLLLFAIGAISPVSRAADENLSRSDRREKELGKEEHEKVLSGAAPLEDPALNAYVTEVGERLAAVSHRPNLGYTFTIIDSPDINAFALPGGYVYVNRGLLAYMNSEAELAAVLGHEIAHITAKHGMERQSRGNTGNILSQVAGFGAAVATGSAYIGSQIAEIGSLLAQDAISGYSRKQELEADAWGAEYLLKAGYDPQAMISVISTLKNTGDFRRRVLNDPSSYHGLFATHPRNDPRLQEAVAGVGQLSPGEMLQVDHRRFREAMDGLAFGGTPGVQVRDERNRYYQSLLNYTMVFPDDWQVEASTTTVEASDPEAGSLHVEARRIQDNMEPRLYIRNRMGISDLRESQPLQQYRLRGHTGVTTDAATGKEIRIAVIYLGARLFIFRGQVDDSVDAAERDAVDKLLLASIRSFRAIQRGELAAAGEKRIRWLQAPAGFDFATAAQTSPIAPYPEETLRLLNGYYPRGGPQPGQWIKVVE